MSITGRPRKTGGTLFHRRNSVFWWIRYRSRDGQILKESTGTEDTQEAERFLRERLDARDDGNLRAVLSGKNLTFDDWADWFLQNRSKPPFRAEKTHLQNLRIVELLRPTLDRKSVV